MKLEVNTPVELGQMLFYVNQSAKTIYKPCPVCDNERTVPINVKGETYKINCPRCTYLKTKGDDSARLTIGVYKFEEVAVEYVQIHANQITYNESINIETLMSKERWSNKIIQHYIDKKECQEIVKSLNMIEKKKADEFINSVSVKEDKP